MKKLLIVVDMQNDFVDDAMHERNLFKLQLMPVFEYKE